MSCVIQFLGFFPLGNGSVISFTERETVELDGILSLEYVEFEYL